MDQDSFRKLLQTPRAAANTPFQRGSLLAAATTSKQKSVEASQPAFKPRTVKKKAEGPYRDRAAERRLGLDNDYAQVEALAEDFERRNADNADRKVVEEQRRYLGGDSTHSVLVKGIDFALLEQNRARAAASAAAEDDVTLERAFLEVSEVSSGGHKRTREEIIQELKNKRAKGSDASDAQQGKPLGPDVALEEAKKAGKFKPIGFRPIGITASKKTKKVKPKEGEGERKKKRKAEIKADEMPPHLPPAPTLASEAGSSKPTVPEPEAESIPEDFDIFADAGEYTGIDLDDDEDSEAEAPAKKKEREAEEGEEEKVPVKRKWFQTEEDNRPSDRATSVPIPSLLRNSRSPPAAGPSAPTVSQIEEGEQEEEEAPVRLQPLASSALPSIRDFLALDSAAEKADKRRARKEKKREGGGQGGGAKNLNAEKDKLDRDHKRLKAYTDKKVAAGGNKV